LKSRAPKGQQWLHEIKFDGYRVQVHLNRGRKKVFTRNGLDWTKRFTEIAGALAILSGGHALTSTPQQPGAGRYFTLPDDEEMQRFLDRGYRLYSHDDYAELFENYGVALGRNGMELR
jgi:hypothetical protein